MKPGMFLGADDHRVRRVVIQPIPVDVVDVLARAQHMTKDSLHDEPVLQEDTVTTLGLDHDASVPEGHAQRPSTMRPLRDHVRSSMSSPAPVMHRAKAAPVSQARARGDLTPPSVTPRRSSGSPELHRITLPEPPDVVQWTPAASTHRAVAARDRAGSGRLSDSHDSHLLCAGQGQSRSAPDRASGSLQYSAGAA